VLADVRLDLAPVRVLPEEAWTARRAAHEARVDTWTAPHLQRAARAEAHPVEDFLFTYYSFRPSRLRRWHPEPGTVLGGAAARDYLAGEGYVAVGAGVTLDVASVVAGRRTTLGFVDQLCRRTASRPATFGCFGLHEWAMVYRQSAAEVRHAAWPLRLDADGVAAVVEGQPLRCTHFDAFRFYTPQARPLNVLQPTRDRVLELEQGGCLHANMDLYKWAYKLAPLTPSELVADAFALARDVRELDMRASPYDLSGLGYAPVRIETAAGRAEYVAAQRAFAKRAEGIRSRLSALCADLLDPNRLSSP
jgi:hypothetical protein